VHLRMLAAVTPRPASQTVAPDVRHAPYGPDHRV
jgi:hypothetical protein